MPGGCGGIRHAGRPPCRSRNDSTCFASEVEVQVQVVFTFFTTRDDASRMHFADNLTRSGSYILVRNYYCEQWLERLRFLWNAYPRKP